VYYKRLERAQFQLLRAFQSGASFADACAYLAETHAGDPGLQSNVRDWFANWSSLGWFYNPSDAANKSRK
jgi:hypothetical protein